MANPKLLYGSFACLGIVFLAIFFPPTIFFPSLGELAVWSKFFSPMWLISSCFFSIVGAVFFTFGICGIGSRYFKNRQNLSSLPPNHVGEQRVKHVKFYGGIAVLGVLFLSMFPAIGYWSEHSTEVTEFFMHTPLAGLLMFIVFLFGGTGLFTVGVCGIVKQYFKNNQNLLTMIVAISIASLILIPVLYWWLSLLTVGF